MQIPLPTTIKIKEQEFKTEDLSPKSKKIIADLVHLEHSIFEAQVKIRAYQLATENLRAMLESETINPSAN